MAKQIFGIVVDDVVPAQIMSIFYEVQHLGFVGGVHGGTVPSQCANVVYGFVVDAHLKIYKGIE